MIRETFVSSLKQKFPILDIARGEATNLVLTSRSKHPEVGDLLIYDDGDEATICIGEITHGHFNPYDSTLTEEELTAEITQSVARFLERLFADRVFLWKSKSGGAGGWHILDDGQPLPASQANRDEFLWSGPLKL